MAQEVTLKMLDRRATEEELSDAIGREYETLRIKRQSGGDLVHRTSAMLE
jgi:hypothetical protein